MATKKRVVKKKTSTTQQRGYHIAGLGFELTIPENGKPIFTFDNGSHQEATIGTTLAYITAYQQGEILRQLVLLNRRKDGKR